MGNKKAFISVYNKDGVVDFAKKLQKEFGYELISTGGTYKELKENGLKVTEISEITGFTELLHGKVKSLHPKIHAGILASRTRKMKLKSLRKTKLTLLIW